MMKLVRENINFKRGIEPKKSLVIGEEDRKKRIVKNIMKFPTYVLSYMGMRNEYEHGSYQHMYVMDNYRWVENWLLEEEIDVLEQMLDDIIERCVHYKANLDIVNSLNENLFIMD